MKKCEKVPKRFCPLVVVVVVVVVVVIWFLSEIMQFGCARVTHAKLTWTVISLWK